MNALAEIPQPPKQGAPRGAAPCVAIVTPHKATYFKPLYEAFAGAQPHPWRTLVVWPEAHRSEHPADLITPVAANLDITRVASRGIGKRLVPAGLSRLLAAARPRAVVIQEYSPFSLAALWFAKRRQIPVVAMSEVGMRNRGFFGWRTQWWHTLCSRWVDGVIAACPAAHEPLCGRKIPSVAAYHAVDARLYRPVEKHAGSAVTFVYLGQLIPRKGLDSWIEAARLLRAAGHENFRLRIIGGGDEAWVRGLARRAGLDDRVEWRGFLSGAALREALGSADVFVLPTRQDTYAAVVHEAACLGLPLLVSRHAGAADALVRDGANGFVIDPADTREFAQRMRILLDAKLRARLSPVSRAIAEEMSAHRRGAALWHWLDEQFALATR